MSNKLQVANQVLQLLFKGEIEKTSNGVFVKWTGYNRKTNKWDLQVRKRWCCRGQDFYPMWVRQYPGGGTSCTALSQLIRWVQDKPVLPISTWRMWAGEKCKLLPIEGVDILLAAGYPERVKCVLCKNQIEGGLDWWSLDKVSGPCCGWQNGCRQINSSNSKN